MSDTTPFTVINDIKCYHPEACSNYNDYPSEGFDVTDSLEEKSFWCRSRNRMLQQLITHYAAKTQPTCFLELGCGTGFFLRQLADAPNFELTGSEIYLNGLHYARQKLPSVNFIQLDASATTMPFKADFDMIGAFDVIEHMEDDQTVLNNSFNMLKPGGYLFITVPQYPALWSQLDDIVKHKRRYTRPELLGKLQQNGFNIVFSSSFVFTLFPLMLLARLWDRRPSKANSKDAFTARVAFPGWMNWLFDKIMRVDEFLIKCGISLPFGGSLLAVAQKPSTPST